MNAMTPIAMDFRSPYLQLDQAERKFVDGYVSDVERIAERSGARLLAVLLQPWPYQLDQRSLAMLARPVVRYAIADRVRELSELGNVSHYKTVKELSAIGYSNMANYWRIDESGVLELDLFDCTPEQMSAIKSIEIEEKPQGGRKIKFQLHDKVAGLTLLMRYQGLLADTTGAQHYRDGVDSEAPAKGGSLPAGIDHSAAADLYSRQING